MSAFGGSTNHGGKAVRSAKMRPIVANPHGSREERRAAKKLGVITAVDWARFAPAEGEETS